MSYMDDVVDFTKQLLSLKNSRKVLEGMLHVS